MCDSLPLYCHFGPGRKGIVSELQSYKSLAALPVVKSIHGQGMGFYGHIVMEIKAGAARFLDAQFVHEGRNSNGDAHRRARSSIYEAVGRHVWLLAPPDRVCTNYNS